MKIKYIFLLFIIITGIRQASYAQKGAFDLGINIGYGFRSAPYTEVSTANGSSTNVTYSLGSGYQGALSANYMLGEHIGAGLSFNYVSGNKAEYSKPLFGSNAYMTTDLKGTLIAAMPYVMVSANNDAINPYGRFGIVLGSATVTSTSNASDNANNPYTLKYSGNLAMGWYVGFGLQYSVSERVMLNAEVFNRSMSYAPKTAKNTANQGGQTQPDITFIKAKDANSSHFTENQIYFPFSSMGIMVGATIRLGGSK